MKLLQAIVSSSPETLDGRQGFGLVVCSRSMPEAVRKAAREWEYPADSNGKPVYSFMIVKDRGASWAVMNHTIPATDFTGRSSYVSHTLAVGMEELLQCFGQRPGNVVTPFEVMFHFPWKERWTQADSPHSMEDRDDIVMDDSFFQKRISEPFRPEGVESTPLLAFEYSMPDSVTPRRVGWKVGALEPKDILGLFHAAWITLDPWRGGRNYGEYLGEPNASLADSWECTFATNLRGGRPDDYQWVVLAPGQVSMASRKVIDIEDWKGFQESDVAREIGGDLGSLLVERSRDPDGWARGLIERRIGEIAADYRKRIGGLANVKEDEIRDKIREISEKHIDYWDNLVKQDRDNSLVSATGHLDSWRSDIDNIENDIKASNRDLDKEFRKNVSPLYALLGKSSLDSSEERVDAISLFPELRAQFEELKLAYEQIYPYGIALNKKCELETELEVLKGFRKESERKKMQLSAEIDRLNNLVKSLAEKISLKTVGNPSLRDKKSPSRSGYGWQLYSLFGASVLVILLSSIILGKWGKKIFSDDPDLIGESSANHGKSDGELGSENISQRNTIDQLKTEIATSEEKYDNLKNTSSIQEQTIAQKDQEIAELTNQNNKLKASNEKKDAEKHTTGESADAKESEKLKDSKAEGKQESATERNDKSDQQKVSDRASEPGNAENVEVKGGQNQ